MGYAPVTHRSTSRRLGGLPSGRDVTVTVHRYVGGQGPTVHVQAAQHGIELNGPAALRRFHDRLLDGELAGEVVVVPVANPVAFDHRSYQTPAAYDARNANMNRSWPGDGGGTFGERLVARLWPLVATADAVIDLHTGTPEMLTHVRHAADDPTARTIAEAFGTGHRLVEPEGSGPETGTLRAAAQEADVPAITAELGNSRAVDRTAAEVGVAGVEGVLQALDARPGEPPTPTQVALRDTPATVSATVAGLFEPASAVAVGERLTAGTTLGTIHDPTSFRQLATPTVDEPGVVYSLATGAVMAGERLAALGDTCPDG